MTSRLFEKFTLNNGKEVPSRLVVAPLTLFSSNPDGTINEGERNYLKQRATGVGLYILGATGVSQDGLCFQGQPRAMTEKDLPSLEERAKIVKSQGALAINQIHHAGCLALKKYSEHEPLAPSADVANETLKLMGQYTSEVKEFTDERIKEIINEFAVATELSLRAGCDGIEFHAAHKYLFQQFYSQHFNKRTDDWGGSEEKRMNFPLKVVDACCKVREKYNRPDFIIGYRLSPEEPFEDGLTMSETLKLIKALETRPIQYIHVSQYDYFRKTRRGEGAGTERLKVIHNEIKGKIALVGIGGLNTEKDINKALDSQLSEFIAVGRASMINRELGILLKENRGNEIEVEIDPEHPEIYCMPDQLWKMSIQGISYFPPIKGKSFEGFKGDP